MKAPASTQGAFMTKKSIVVIIVMIVVIIVMILVITLVIIMTVIVTITVTVVPVVIVIGQRDKVAGRQQEEHRERA